MFDDPTMYASIGSLENSVIIYAESIELDPSTWENTLSLDSYNMPSFYVTRTFTPSMTVKSVILHD